MLRKAKSKTNSRSTGVLTRDTKNGGVNKRIGGVMNTLKRPTRYSAGQGGTKYRRGKKGGEVEKEIKPIA